MNDCPSHIDLLAYLQGQLPAPQSQGVEAHLEGCEGCLQSLETLGSDLNQILGGLKVGGSTIVQMTETDGIATTVASAQAVAAPAPNKDSERRPAQWASNQLVVGMMLGCALSFAFMTLRLPSDSSMIAKGEVRPSTKDVKTSEPQASESDNKLALLERDISRLLKSQARSLEDQRALYNEWQAVYERSRNSVFESQVRRQIERLRNTFEQRAQFYYKSQLVDLQRAIQELNWPAIEAYIESVERLYPTELRDHIKALKKQLRQQRQSFIKSRVYEYGIREQDGRRFNVNEGFAVIEKRLAALPNHRALALQKAGIDCLKLSFKVGSRAQKYRLALKLACTLPERYTFNYTAYSDVFVNGQVLCGRYSPQTYNWSFHDWDISEFVKAGENTLEIKLHKEADNQLWIEHVRILAIDKRR